MNLVKFPNPYTSKTRKELVKYSYDLLLSLAERESFDKIIFTNGTVRLGWEQLMARAMNSLVPGDMVYNMTVYNMSYVNGTVRQKALNSGIITNSASLSQFSSLKEIAAADITYTTRKQWILRIHLEVAPG